MMTRIALLLCATVSILGCATTGKLDDMLGSWKGQSVDVAIERWGPPDKEYPLQSGGKMLQWTKGGTTVIPGYTYSTPQTTYENGTATANGPNGPAQASYNSTKTTYAQQQSSDTTIHFGCTIRLAIDASSRIQSWQYSGNYCKKE